MCNSILRSSLFVFSSHKSYKSCQEILFLHCQHFCSDIIERRNQSILRTAWNRKYQHILLMSTQTWRGMHADHVKPCKIVPTVNGTNTNIRWFFLPQILQYPYGSRIWLFLTCVNNACHIPFFCGDMHNFYDMHHIVCIYYECGSCFKSTQDAHGIYATECINHSLENLVARFY